MKTDPEFATTMGIHDFDDRLETFTEQAFHSRKVRLAPSLWFNSRLTRVHYSIGNQEKGANLLKKL